MGQIKTTFCKIIKKKKSRFIGEDKFMDSWKVQLTQKTHSQHYSALACYRSNQQTWPEKQNTGDKRSTVFQKVHNIKSNQTKFHDILSQLVVLEKIKSE